MQKLIEFYNFNKRKLVLSFVFIAICIASFAGIYFFNIMSTRAESISLSLEQENDDLENFEEVTLKNIENTSSAQSVKYKVDIKGLVKKPGVYELSVESRVIDVINKAGGLLNDADTSVINLSKKITDEMVIIIYSKEEVKNFLSVSETEEILNESCTQNNSVLKNNACIDDSNNFEEDKESSLVNINTASLEQLQTLPGIGESKAKAIIAYREEIGIFEKIEDIKNVSGIGDAVFEKIKNNITV